MYIVNTAMKAKGRIGILGTREKSKKEIERRKQYKIL